MISKFSKYDYDCCKLIREIQIMSSLSEINKDKKTSEFIPRLIDVVIPDISDHS